MDDSARRSQSDDAAKKADKSKKRMVLHPDVQNQKLLSNLFDLVGPGGYQTKSVIVSWVSLAHPAYKLNWFQIQLPLTSQFLPNAADEQLILHHYSE